MVSLVVGYYSVIERVFWDVEYVNGVFELFGCFDWGWTVRCCNSYAGRWDFLCFLLFLLRL